MQDETTSTLILSDEANDILREVTHGECRKQVLTFAHLYRRKLSEKSVDPTVLTATLKEALSEFAKQCTSTNLECMQLVQEAIHTILHSGDKGRDIIGRMITHYCFRRPEAIVKVPNEGHELELKARKQVVPGVLPRPLLGYFLISIRGTLDGIDSFKALPILMGTNLEEVEGLTATARDIAEDYRIATQKNAPVHWQAMFRDNRCKELAYRLLSKITERLEGMGQESFLRTMDNLQQKKRNTPGNTVMERLFTESDVALVFEAVADSVRLLAPEEE